MTTITDRDQVLDPIATIDDHGEVTMREEPFPRGPNDDMGNLAAPPSDVDEPRISDDNDLEAEGGGFTDTPLRRPYEAMGRRDEIARQLEELLINAQEWADEDGSAEALDFYESLNDVFQQLGEPTEDTDD